MVWQAFFSLESLSPLSLLFPENGPKNFSNHWKNPTIFSNHWKNFSNHWKTAVSPVSYQMGQNPEA